jgi:ABC-type nickel/cobalt efflux system permease component RcnA
MKLSLLAAFVVAVTLATMCAATMIAPAGAASLVDQRAAAARPSPGLRNAGPWTRTIAYIREQQQHFYRSLAGAVKRIKTDGSVAAAWALVSLSFLYGIFHAAGPGHGKAVISAYLLANERQVRRGVVLAFLASLMQAISAIALVVVFVFLLGLAGRNAQANVQYLEQASYGLICLIGIAMMWRALMPHRHGGQEHHDHGHGHHHEHGAGCGHAHIPLPAAVASATSVWQMASIVFAVGIRPCSGAVLVLVYANIIGLFLVGIGATFAMALGTAITVSALAILTLVSKGLAVRLVGETSPRLALGFRILAVLGSGLIILIGVVLLIGSTGPQRPFI